MDRKPAEKPSTTDQAAVEVSVQRPTLKERQWQLREEAILDAVQEVIAEKGYRAMTVDDIAVAVGISKPTLYQHFSSKEEMVAHVAIRILRNAAAYVSSLDPTKPAAQRLGKIIEWGVELRFGPNSVLLSEAEAEVYPITRTHAVYLASETQLVESFTALFDDAKAEGLVDIRLSSVALSRALLACFREVGYEALITEGRITTDELKTTIKGMFLKCPNLISTRLNNP